MTAPWRPGPPRPGHVSAPRPEPARVEGERPPAADDDAGAGVETGHPAVDGAVRAMANAADLPPGDQIAEYEAAHRTLRETLATIDET